MFRYIVFLMMFLLLIGCSSTDKVNDYADYQMTFFNDMEVFSQYEIVYRQQIKEGEYTTIVAPFLANENTYLPQDVVKLHLGVKVINPELEDFSIWIEYQFIEIDTKKEFHRTKKLVYKSQGLPEEFFSIDLPFRTNIHSQVRFRSTMYTGNGGMLYRSAEAFYKIKGS